MEFVFCKDGFKTRVVYWEEFDLPAVEKYMKDVDTLEARYPRNVDELIREKYEDFISYIEYKGHWGGQTHSIEIDLSQSEEAILRQFNKTCIYEVRRAESRDKLYFDISEKPNQLQIQEYLDFYDMFANQKNRAKIDRNIVEAILESGRLYIAVARDEERKPLVMHGYLVDSSRGFASLYTSSSLFRNTGIDANAVSRANRWLHYQAMIFFKHKGILTYDMGGLYIGDENEELSRISQFKSGFGGKIIDYSSSFIIHRKEAEILENRLSELSNSFIEKDVVVWGANWKGKYLRKLLERNYGIKVLYFIDNKLSKDNDIYVGEEVLGKVDENKSIILLAMNSRSCSEVLKKTVMEKYVANGTVVSFS